MSSSDSSAVYYVLTIRSIMALGKSVVPFSSRISTDALYRSSCVLLGATGVVGNPKVLTVSWSMMGCRRPVKVLRSEHT